jgi:hypothetical protein
MWGRDRSGRRERKEKREKKRRFYKRQRRQPTIKDPLQHRTVETHKSVRPHEKRARRLREKWRSSRKEEKQETTGVKEIVIMS